MEPEAVATEADGRGWNREDARRKLMNDFPTLVTDEIDKVLDTVYGDQSEQPVENGMRRAETA